MRVHLKIQGVRFSYNSTPILKGINFSVKKGELVSILGINGAGKSTLLKTINLILKPQKGTVILNGEIVEKYTNRERARLIGYVPQFCPRRAMTVFDAVLLGRKPYIMWDVKELDIKKAKEVLNKLFLQNIALRNISELSGGEFQKVMIARALAQEPEVLLLDEPTTNLDMKNQTEVMNLIRKITKEKNISTIMVIHDVNLALRYSDKFIFMKAGKVHQVGGKEIITEDNIWSIYGVKTNVIKNSDVLFVVPI